MGEEDLRERDAVVIRTDKEVARLWMALNAYSRIPNLTNVVAEEWG